MSEKWTKGPWAWFGNAKTNHVYLATTNRGRQYVMRFRRWGMRSAQPEFQTDGILVPARDLVTFAVGNNQSVGFEEGKADPSVYRYQIAGINHPDARLIAAAPDLAEALEELLGAENRYNERPDSLVAATKLDAAIKQARTALRKANGETE